MEMGQKCGKCFHRSHRSLEERRDELRPPAPRIYLWSLDLDTHHYFLSCSSGNMGGLDGNIKGTPIDKAEHGTGPFDLLSNV